MEHFQFLHHRQTAFVRKTIQEGTLGEIRLLRSTFGFPPLDPGNFRYDARLGGGALLDAGAYTLRISHALLGHDLQVGAATMERVAPGDVDISGAAFLLSERGCRARWPGDSTTTISARWISGGRRGVSTQDRAFTAPPGYSPRVTVETGGLRQEHQIAPDDHFVNLWRDFYQRVVDRTLEPSLADILTQARLIRDVRLRADVKGSP